MAELTVGEGTVTLALSRLECLEGFHGSITVPVAAVVDVRAVGDTWAELRGIRAPGTGLPGVVMVGTRRGSFGRDFAAVHGRGRGVVVELEGQEFTRWVLTVADPEDVRDRVARAVGRS